MVTSQSNELSNLNLESLEVVSYYRDPQFQATENYLDLWILWVLDISLPKTPTRVLI